MNTQPATAPRLTLPEIREARAGLGDRILKTPIQPLSGPAVEAAFAPGTQAVLKLELFQRTDVEYWVAKVTPGKVLFEIEGVTEETAREAFKLAAAKLSVATAFVRRQVR